MLGNILIESTKKNKKQFIIFFYKQRLSIINLNYYIGLKGL